MTKKLLLPVIVLALFLAACQPSAQQAQAAFCTSLQGLQEATANLKTINKDTTVDQAKQYTSAYETAWQNVAKANQTMKSAQFNELQSAHDNLTKSLQSINGQTTIEAAVPQIQSAYTTFAGQVQSIRDTSCKQ